MNRRTTHRAPRATGFTLIEILVAVAVFAVISAITFVTLNEVLKTGARGREALARLAEVQRGFSRMAMDFDQAVPRAVRNQYGGTDPAMTWQDDRLVFTRGGHLNLLDRARSNLQRVAYGLNDDDQLVRYTWPTLDQPIGGASPTQQVVLDRVTALTIRYNLGGKWVDDWPPLTAQGQPPGLPAAVSIKLTLEDYGEINRTFALPE